MRLKCAPPKLNDNENVELLPWYLALMTRSGLALPCSILSKETRRVLGCSLNSLVSLNGTYEGNVFVLVWEGGNYGNALVDVETFKNLSILTAILYNNFARLNFKDFDNVALEYCNRVKDELVRALRRGGLVRNKVNVDFLAPFPLSLPQGGVTLLDFLEGLFSFFTPRKGVQVYTKVNFDALFVIALRQVPDHKEPVFNDVVYSVAWLYKKVLFT